MHLRDGGDDDGWKLDDSSALQAESEDDVYHFVDAAPTPPPTVQVTKEVARDLDALLQFYRSDDPEFLLVRPRGSDDVVYFGGDASAAAYGAGIQHVDGRVTVYGWEIGLRTKLRRVQTGERQQIL